MAHDVGLVDPEALEYRADVAGLGLLVVAVSRPRRQAHAAQVGHDDAMVLRQCARQRRPHVARIAEAVQQHDRRAVATDAHVQARAVDLDLLRAEVCGERLGLCMRRQCRREGDQAGTEQVR